VARADPADASVRADPADLIAHHDHRPPLHGAQVPRHAVPIDWSGPLRALAMVAAVAIVIAVVLFWRAAPRPLEAEPSTTGASEAALSLGDSSSTPAPTAGSNDRAGAVLVVHVVGRVKKPGVVRLPPGARVADAIAAAGGLAAGVKQDSVNLARPVSDGEQVVVAQKSASSAASALGGDPVTGGSGTGGDGNALLDLNVASADQLEELDGVGPVLAERIVAWRDEHGRFASVDDLREVSGIGPKIFERLASQVVV
jgi:competence protein ComEA